MSVAMDVDLYKWASDHDELYEDKEPLEEEEMVECECCGRLVNAWGLDEEFSMFCDECGGEE